MIFFHVYGDVIAASIANRAVKEERIRELQSILSSMAAELNSSLLLYGCVFVFVLLAVPLESEAQAFRRDPGHPHWHHGAFHTVRDSVRHDVRRMLHSRAEVFLLVYILPYHDSASLIL